MYEVLAEFYDLFMQDVDYDSWCDFIARHIPKNGKGLDVGCGSGAFTLRLASRGYDVSGIDLSSEMIEIALKNAKRSGYDIDFTVENAEQINLTEKLDFVTAVCDVVNYIKNPFDFFKNTYNNLNDNGVFAFDISSEYKLKKILGNNVYTEEKDGVVYVWSNTLRPKRVDMSLSFFRQDKDGRYTRFDEKQTQYIHKEEDLVISLFNAGFESVQTFADFGEQVEKTTERIHFIAKKAKFNGKNS